MDEEKKDAIVWLVHDRKVNSEADLAVLEEADLKDNDSGSFHGAFGVGNTFRRSLMMIVQCIALHDKQLEGLTTKEALRILCVTQSGTAVDTNKDAWAGPSKDSQEPKTAKDSTAKPAAARTPSPNENVPAVVCVPRQVRMFLPVFIEYCGSFLTHCILGQTVASPDSSSSPTTMVGSVLSPGKVMRPINLKNAPPMASEGLEVDPFFLPSTWDEANSGTSQVVKVFKNATFVESMNNKVFVAAWCRVWSDKNIYQELADDVLVAMANKLNNVLSNTAFVESMEDEVLVMVMRIIVGSNDNNIQQALDDDTVATIAIRAHSKELITAYSEADAFWNWKPNEKPLQKDISPKVTPYTACFMAKADFRRMLTGISDNALKSLDDSVKQIVIARCGDKCDSAGTKAALNIQVVKSKKNFLKCSN